MWWSVRCFFLFQLQGTVVGSRFLQQPEAVGRVARPCIVEPCSPPFVLQQICRQTVASTRRTKHRWWAVVYPLRQGKQLGRVDQRIVRSVPRRAQRPGYPDARARRVQVFDLLVGREKVPEIHLRVLSPRRLSPSDGAVDSRAHAIREAVVLAVDYGYEDGWSTFPAISVTNSYSMPMIFSGHSGYLFSVNSWVELKPCHWLCFRYSHSVRFQVSAVFYSYLGESCQMVQVQVGVTNCHRHWGCNLSDLDQPFTLKKWTPVLCVAQSRGQFIDSLTPSLPTDYRCASWASSVSFACTNSRFLSRNHQK